MGKRDDLFDQAEKLGLNPARNATIATLTEAIEMHQSRNAPPESDAGAARSGAAPTPPEAGPTVTVVGPKQGRRRAGRSFTSKPVTIPLSELDEAEIEALRGDPLLIVSMPADAG